MLAFVVSYIQVLALFKGENAAFINLTDAGAVQLSPTFTRSPEHTAGAGQSMR
jgi:hypothetical protein